MKKEFNLNELARINDYFEQINDFGSVWVNISEIQKCCDIAKILGVNLCGGAINDECTEQILYK